MMLIYLKRIAGGAWDGRHARSPQQLCGFWEQAREAEEALPLKLLQQLDSD